MKGLYAIIFIVIICISLLGIAAAENTLIDFSNFSVSELLDIRDEINRLLEEKGYSVYFDIERGDKGEHVLAIQERLMELGFYSGKITGKMDSETQKAFKAFEKANNLDNDGSPSREDQIVLFADWALGKAVSDIQGEAAENSVKNIERLAEHDPDFDYEQCLRYPEEYIETKYTLKGKVAQTLGDRSDGFQIRFAVLGNVNEIIYLFVNEDPGYNILEGDWLIVDSIMKGTVTYESILGQEITIPAAVAENVVLR